MVDQEETEKKKTKEEINQCESCWNEKWIQISAEMKNEFFMANLIRLLLVKVFLILIRNISEIKHIRKEHNISNQNWKWE